MSSPLQNFGELAARKARAAIKRAFRHSASIQAALFRSAWTTRNSPESFASYFDDDAAPHRAAIADIIRPLEPQSVYEFGCYSAPTLRLLSRELPNAKLFGTDINPHAVAFAASRLPAVQLAAADDSSTAFLEKWLPNPVDVTIVSSVFYSMSASRVAATLAFLSGRSRYVLLGCNMGNFDGTATRVEKDGLLHPYGSILSTLVLDVVSRHPSPKQDISLTEFALLRARSAR